MVSVTSGSKSGISKKSLYKPAPKEKIKAKRTNRKPLAQGQLIDLNNPRSAKNLGWNEIITYWYSRT